MYFEIGSTLYIGPHLHTTCIKSFPRLSGIYCVILNFLWPISCCKKSPISNSNRLHKSFYVAIRLRRLDFFFKVDTLLLPVKQFCGSVSFWYGSGSSDPFREITDPAPNSTLNRENINFCLTFFSIKNIFLRNMTCFDIYGVNIYVSKYKLNRIRFIEADPDPQHCCKVNIPF